MQQLVEVRGRNTPHSFDLVDQPFAHHVARDAHGGGGGALAGACLEEIELAALDRELQVLHVVVVALEPVLRVHQLLVRAGKLLRHIIDLERSSDSGDDVLALSVDEELTVEAPLARRWIARKRDAGS